MFSIVLAFLITIGFLINIPFYIYWLKQQKPSEELDLYHVDGRYTYYTVLELISKIENATQTKLTKERNKIDKWKAVCDKRNVPIKAYKKKIHRLLKEKAFGKRMMVTSFRRMPKYSKITAVWNVFVLLGIANGIVGYIDPPSIGTRLITIFFSFTIAAPLWLLVHRLFNMALKSAAMRWAKNKLEPAGLHLAMAHFWGFTGGLFWKDLVWQVGPNPSYRRMSNYGYYSGYSNFGGGSDYSDFGGFGGGGFGGGGAGGDW